MANGEACRHCGWQESEHENWLLTMTHGLDALMKETDEYCSLFHCPGFEPSSSESTGYDAELP